MLPEEMKGTTIGGGGGGILGGGPIDPLRSLEGITSDAATSVKDADM
jgi:hypothetical protein